MRSRPPRCPKPRVSRLAPFPTSPGVLVHVPSPVLGQWSRVSRHKRVRHAICTRHGVVVVALAPSVGGLGFDLPFEPRSKGNRPETLKGKRTKQSGGSEIIGRKRWTIGKFVEREIRDDSGQISPIRVLLSGIRRFGTAPVSFYFGEIRTSSTKKPRFLYFRMGFFGGRGPDVERRRTCAWKWTVRNAP